jgi:hypothetical protein
LKELLTNLVITGTVVGQLSFKTLAEILSKPGALLLDKLLITDSTSFSLTFWNPNLSVSAGRLNSTTSSLELTTFFIQALVFCFQIRFDSSQFSY